MQPSAVLVSLLTLSLATASPLAARADTFSGKGQIRLKHETTHVDSGCLTATAQFTTDESSCGTFTGTLTTVSDGGGYPQADIQSSGGGYLGFWKSGTNGALEADLPKPGKTAGSRWLSLNFSFVAGGPYLGTGYINNFATWGANPPTGKATSALETSKSNTPSPSYVLGWKAL